MAAEWRPFLGPAGYKAWRSCGRLHRADGPALEGRDGSREYFLHGKLHRPDGPAVILANGFEAWYTHGELVRISGKRPSPLPPDSARAGPAAFEGAPPPAPTPASSP